MYKLSATKSQGDSKWKARLKVTEMSSKLTLPGVLDVRRFFFEDGRIAGDMVFDVNEPVNAEDKIIDPSDLLRQKSLAGLASETLLRPLSRDGKSVLAAEDRCAMAAQARAKEALGKLDESQKRLLNPMRIPWVWKRACGIAVRRWRSFVAKKSAGKNSCFNSSAE